jgi:hypothetical protein
MFKNFGYYIFFFVLILIFGVSGISNVLNSKTVYIASGTVIAISLCLAVWITVTRRTFKNIKEFKSKPEEPKSEPDKPKARTKAEAKPKAKAKAARKVKK